MIESEFDLHPLQVIWYYLSKFLGLLVFFFILRHFWGEYMLLDLGDLKGKGGVSFSGLGHIWWFGLWALAAGILSAIVSSNTIYVDDKPTAMLKGWWLSINAGIWEELIYRWLLFVTSMVVLPFLNYITLGLVKWFFGTLFVPFANFMSFHSLEAQLHYGPWFFGCGLPQGAQPPGPARCRQCLVPRPAALLRDVPLRHLHCHRGAHPVRPRRLHDGGLGCGHASITVLFPVMARLNNYK
jgi:hypothetical protein